MFKDPDQQSTNPYELLHLEPDASLTQLNLALPRFMKDPANRAQLGKAMEALRKLRSGRERAAIDVWLYDLESLECDFDGEIEADFSLDEFLQAPRLAPEDFPSDLEAGAVRAGPPELVLQKVKLTELKRYGELEGSAWQPEFDR